MKKVLKNIIYSLWRKMGLSSFIYAETSKYLNPIDLAAEFICTEQIVGDYLEFGVFKGDSFIDAYHKIENTIKDWSSKERAYMAYSNKLLAEEAFSKIIPMSLRYFAFDSFQGLPQPQGIDCNHARFAKGRYDCNEKEFKRILHKNKVNLNKVVTIPGYYNTSLLPEVKKRHQIKSASIIMIDCDLYESAKIVLDFITDLVIDGTVIIFDDWFSYRGNPNFGERRACQEWLNKNSNFSLTEFARWGITQNSFIVHKR